jgi:hypothetical protein
VRVREQIGKKWTPDMDLLPVRTAQVRQPSPKRKPNRAERRAAKKDAPRTEPTTEGGMTGGKDMPIVIDSSGASSPQLSPAESAAEKLRATGSIRGITRTLISID